MRVCVGVRASFESRILRLLLFLGGIFTALRFYAGSGNFHVGYLKYARNIAKF